MQLVFTYSLGPCSENKISCNLTHCKVHLIERIGETILAAAYDEAASRFGGETKMKSAAMKVAVSAVAGCMLLAVPAFASSENQQGQGQAVITVLPAKNAAPATVTQQDLSLKVNGKETSITSLEPLNGANSKVEVVVLIDDSARSGLGNQINDIANFIKTLPANAAVAVGYMDNGRAALGGPLSTDRDQAVKALHLPLGMPGVNASPYFSLDALAKNWPSNDPDARREVVMVTNGVDNYDRGYDPYDPYLQTAINDAVKAHMIVYSIYWQDAGRSGRGMFAANAGQNLLLQVTDATGGNSYWMGMGNPVSLIPYLDDIKKRLDNQYELSFVAPSNGRIELANLKLKVNNGTKVAAPQQVAVTAGSAAGGEQ
jgi:hypothetical protein